MADEKGKYFFKGQYYDNEEEFFKATREWPFECVTEESFLLEWERLGKDIWFNMEITNRTKDLRNGAMTSILEEFFLNVFQKYIAKEEVKDGG